MAGGGELQNRDGLALSIAGQGPCLTQERAGLSQRPSKEKEPLETVEEPVGTADESARANRFLDTPHKGR